MNGTLLKRLVPGAAGQTLRALKHRNFRLFFFGQLTSLTGSWMQSLAQGWLVWRLTHSAWLLGLVGFFQMAPVLFLGLLGGVAADRFDRHRIVIATQTAALIQSVILAALTLAGVITVWEILALAAVLGVVNAFDMPGRQAFLVQMVGREDLGNAIALNSSIFNGARIVGPAIAGFVVSRWGEGACFAVNAVTFLAVLASLFAMRLEKRTAARPPGGTWQRLQEGFAYSWRTPHVRALLTLVTVTSLFAFPYIVFLPALAGGVLNRDATGLGILMTFSGVGALSGALVLAHREGIRGLGRLTGHMAMAFGAALVLFGYSSDFWLSCFALALVGFFMMCQMAATNTLLQSLVPEDLRGRLMSLYVITFVGVAPVGSLIMGKVAERVGVQAAIMGGGLVTVVAGLVFRLSVPRIRRAVLPLLPNEPRGMV
jgi:MFS family permease